MQLKSLVRYPIDIRRAQRLLESQRAPANAFWRRPIALDLQSADLLIDCGRHLASLAHFAQLSGSRMLVRCNRILLAAIARKIHGREMLAEPYVWWVPPAESLPDDAFVMRDHQLCPTGVRMLIGRDLIAGVPKMPYPMHPATLPLADDQSLQQLRKTSDRKGIFFAGNQKPKYGREKMQKEFGVISRLDVIETLRQSYPDRVTSTLAGFSLRDAIILSDSRSESIQPSRWLNTLARARYFLCCPGASQPMCHNLIEAMSVGTVPVIEYGDRLAPALQDGVNAITFRGKFGLIQAIKRIDGLSNEQHQQLSLGAAQYYDHYLRGERFLAGLRDGTIVCSGGVVCLPFHDRNLYSDTEFARMRQAA